jgi:hypothetical protein
LEYLYFSGTFINFFALLYTSGEFAVAANSNYLLRLQESSEIVVSELQIITQLASPVTTQTRKHKKILKTFFQTHPFYSINEYLMYKE